MVVVLGMTAAGHARSTYQEFPYQAYRKVQPLPVQTLPFAQPDVCAYRHACASTKTIKTTKPEIQINTGQIRMNKHIDIHVRQPGPVRNGQAGHLRHRLPAAHRHEHEGQSTKKKTDRNEHKQIITKEKQHIK